MEPEDWWENKLRKKRGIYELDLWVKYADLVGGSQLAGFPRPGH